MKIWIELDLRRIKCTLTLSVPRGGTQNNLFIQTNQLMKHRMFGNVDVDYKLRPTLH